MPYSPNKREVDAVKLRPPPKLSIVVPCFNEEESLPLLLEGITKLNDILVKAEQISEPLTLVLVDDGSSDNTWSLISNIKSSFNIQGVKLSRNSGHQSALLAGLMQAQGDIMISMDADLQDDPIAAVQMVERFRQGDEIVFGVRASRTTDSFFKRTSAHCYYRLLSVFGVELIPNHADYRLMSAKARDALAMFGESNVYLRGLIHRLGFKSSIVTYNRAARVAGESKYNMRRMVGLAIDGVTSFSVRPLRLITLFGFCVASISFFAIVYAWVGWMAGAVVPGWTSLILPIYFLGGAHLVALGVIGEYIGKIYTETKARPQFIIDTKIHTNAKLDDHAE
ncbi:glycosyltransferase family 2 protein [Pacificibacter marinus]|uniref:Putative glycosyltransferase YkoT n=1 Tax=Pacificibacter marinus TaxID=658057 RepID=A0A1Y5SIR9_9RHOB|nr:glycosyltransferase family 2 protein [Pacificibacter marinus]SEK60937.1 Glycosyltransferase involved in cell wall bisynthesis [Pacificibacter marinus]SLN41777.1 putative glycosyltransferase YkoT [Pacificibacter marinus]